MFYSKFHGRLEKVYIQPGSSIELIELFVRLHTFKAIITYNLPDHDAILLFNKALVVLLIGSTTGECNLVLFTEVNQFLIDEFGAVVNIHS